MAAIETVVHSVLDRSRRKLIMASIKANALMSWALANKRIETEPGGRNIQNPIIFGRNPNVGSYSYYDPLPVAQTNEFETLEYAWSRVAGTMIISDQEKDENRGPEAIFKLTTAKLKVLEESIKEKFSSYAYGAGAGSDPNGLTNLVPADPTTGSLAGINRANEVQWRTSSYDFAGSLDETNIEEALDDTCMDLTLKNDKPNLILMGRNIYRTMRAAVRDKMVLNLNESRSGKNMIDLGFEGVKHGGKTILYDEDCPVNAAWFVNDKHLTMHILKGVNMRSKALTAPWTVDATGRRVVWQGQWCLWKAYRTHAYWTN